MRLLASTVRLAAAISIAAAAVPALVGAAGSACEPNVTGPVGVPQGSAGGVNVHRTADNSVSWCSATLIEANSDIPNGTNYPVRATSPGPSDNPVSNAISIHLLLTLAGVNPATVGFTYVVRSNSTWATLDTADLAAQPTTFEGGLMPIVFINGSETDYLRPLRSATDANADDFLVAENGAPVDLYVSSGPLLDVTASVTPTRVSINKSVTFTAQVTNQSATDGTLTYKWSFHDGRTATGASVQHSFSAVGSYYPTVAVQGAGNDSGGVSQPVAVTVGSPPKGGSSGTPGGTNPKKNATPGGPSRGRGKTPNTTPSPKPTGGSGANSTPGSNQTPAQPRTTSPAKTTSATTAATAHKPSAKGHRRGGKGARSSSHRHAQRYPGTTVVDGRLVSDVIPLSRAQLAALNSAAGQRASQATAPSARLGGGSLTPVAGVVGGCVIMLLLGSGAGSELRSQRRPVAPKPVA